MNRTGMYLNWIALQTLLRKEIFRFLRIWSQTLLPPAITMALYFLIFGKFIGSQLHTIEGYSYMQYIVPGLVMMAVMTNAYSNTATSFFLVKFNKSIEELLVSPMATVVMLLGFLMGGVMRGIFTGIIVLFISFLFTHVPIEHPFIMVLVGILAAVIFSLGGLINAVYAKRFDDISFIPTFVLTPLTYLGGVFYSLQQLPPFWRSISRFNPILDIVDAFRFGLLGISDVNLYFALALIIGLAVFLFLWSWVLLDSGKGTRV